MALGHRRRGHASELGVLPQVSDGLRAAVAHAGAQATDHLVDEVAQRPAVRHAAFDAFGNQLAGGLHVGLAVAVLAALDHGAHRAHAAVGLIAAALVDDHFAGALIQPSEHTAHHAAACPSGDGLGDVS